MTNEEALAELKDKILNIEQLIDVKINDDFEQIYNLIEILEDHNIATKSANESISYQSDQNEKFKSELLLSEERFKIVVRNANALIFILDINGIINLSEGRALNLFKLLPNQIEGISIYDIYDDNPEVIEAFKKALTGATTTTNMEIQDFVFEMVFSPYTDYNGIIKGIVAIAVNVTDRERLLKEREELIENLSISGTHIMKDAERLIRLNDNLIDSEQRLQKMNNEKDKFISIISHDIRSPFNGIIGIIDGLVAFWDSYTNSELKAAVEMIKKTSHDLHDFLENLLIWTRANRGRIDVNLESTPLYPMIKSNIDLLINNTQQKNITIKNLVNRNIFVLADENILNTIFRNILSNAIKFTENSGEIVVSTHATLDNDISEIWIADNGIGMPKEIADNIFNLNRHYTSLGTNNEKGTGLGLFICKEMIDQLNGRIWVESQEGVGTCFKMELKSAISVDYISEEILTESIDTKNENFDFFIFTQEEVDEYDFSNLKELVENLKENYLPESIEALDMQILGIISEFADKLMQIATIYQFPVLLRFSNSLTEKIKLIDVVQINKYLEYFPELVNKFDNYILSNK